MPDTDDMDLVRDYAERNSEASFAELVHRHINLVYSVALRFTANHEDAEDVTQAVFIILAQKVAKLGRRTVLTGWLYETTRFIAMRLLRTRIRKQAREQEAYMQSSLNDSNIEGVWKQLAPLLEEAMSRLSEKERTLLALRFFENKSGAETAAILGVQEWAAHKRTARAVEKLRMFFAKRGVVASAVLLTTAISANSVHAAPVALTKSVTAVAIAKGAAASGSTLALLNGALKLMARSKIKMAIIAGTGTLLAIGATTTFVIPSQDHVQAARTDFPRSIWSFAGYADPVSAFETVFWATTQNDGKAMINGLTPELQQRLQQHIGPEWRSLAEYLSPDRNSAIHLGGITGFRVLKSEVVSDDQVVLQLSIQGRPGEQVFKMKKIGNEWKMDDFPPGL